MPRSVQYVVELHHYLDALIRDHGHQLFLGFMFVCLYLIARIIRRGLRRPPPPPPDEAEAKRRAIIGIMMASDNHTAFTADGGRTDAIWGKPVLSEPRDPDRR